jgi:hypothetical protein
MNFFRLLALPATLTLALSQSAFADDDLAPRFPSGCTVTIITEPANSDVYLDGVDLGKSPINKKPFRCGPLKLVVMDQGKELINTRFNVWKNKDNVFKGETIMPHGVVKVTTGALKCQVLMDGDVADRTDGGPLTLNSVDAGSHTIGVQCGGHKYVEELVKVEGEQTTEINFDMSKKPPKITVKSAKTPKADD